MPALEPREPPFPVLLAHDLRTGKRLVAGADESGRNAMAGPLVAAACLFDWAAVSDADLERLQLVEDSKDVDDDLLPALRLVIIELAECVCEVVVSVEEIDRDGNVDPGNMRALRAAVDGLEPEPDVCFIDSYDLPGCRYPTIGLAKGDSTSAAVAAASVVAKATHDAFMLEIANEFPCWGFEKHRGYNTPGHRDVLRYYRRLTRHHRRTHGAAILRELGLAEPGRRVRRGQTPTAPPRTT
jgi:ribonuclease HII